MTRLRFVLALIACGVLTACGSAPEGPAALPLASVAGWPQWPDGQAAGQVTAVDVDADNRVFVLHRPGRDWPVGDFPTDPIPADTVTVFDGPTGALLDAWGSGEMVMPHGLSIAPDGSVWITDAGREQVLHYTPDGDLIGTIGTMGETGDDDTHFGRATDVGFDRGDILVGDGYLNARIARFMSDGGYVSQFGGHGGGAGQFRLPHSVEVSEQAGDIIVADRENMRVLVMDRAGEVSRTVNLAPFQYPYAAKRMQDGSLLIAQGRDGQNMGTARLIHVAANSDAPTLFDLAPGDDGPHRAHDLAIGPDGAIYVADVMAERVYKVAPGALEKN
ncbi:hypothetical protein [Croceicoccus mobilis]|uniref:6-bladed beta-propeller n=1 Tax=Croceicoccus mobilis TaxID=1703339 RepID=A0A917DYB9_9SPHN|nr:hypothetical protein [Croceicoccus mobilis]GGD78318.1 hypothetical protein GCM10010990_30200 [Croceicoccus mobilis]